MLKTSAFARTVRCGKLRDLNANKEGKQPSYVINFTIATDRNYLRTVTDENGETKKVKDSDFMNCCAYGNLAKVIDKNFNIYDEEDKFISRRILVHGNIEKYKTESKVTIEKVLQIEIDGKPRNIKCSFEQPIRYENTRLSVSDIEFVDATPENIKNKKSDAVVVANAVLLDESEEISEDQLVNANVVKETDITNKELTSEKDIEENSEDIADKIQQFREKGDFDEANKLNSQMNSNMQEEQEEQEEQEPEFVNDLSTNGDAEL